MREQRKGQCEATEKNPEALPCDNLWSGVENHPRHSANASWRRNVSVPLADFPSLVLTLLPLSPPQSLTGYPCDHFIAKLTRWGLQLAHDQAEEWLFHSGLAFWSQTLSVGPSYALDTSLTLGRLHTRTPHDGHCRKEMRVLSRDRVLSTEVKF